MKRKMISLLLILLVTLLVGSFTLTKMYNDGVKSVKCEKPLISHQQIGDSQFTYIEWKNHFFSVYSWGESFEVEYRSVNKSYDLAYYDKEKLLSAKKVNQNNITLINSVNTTIKNVEVE